MAATPDLTLDEAAEFLGLSPTEFKQKLKLDSRFKRLDASKKRDGSSFRFPRAILEEVARELGAASNFDIPILDLDSGRGQAPSGVKHTQSADEPIDFGSSDDDAVFTLAADEPQPTMNKPKTDSDSDVRLDGGKSKSAGKGGSDDAASLQTEEISLDLGGPPSSAVIKGGSSSKLTAPKSSIKLSSESGKGLSKPGSGDSSEFELSLDADSDDFELKLNTEISDEVDIGEMPGEKEGSSSRRASESGILSRKPADSGISLEKGKLEKGKGKEPEKPRTGPSAPAEDSSDSDVDFELTLDSAAAVSGTRLGGPKSKKPLTSNSDSEFELSLDDVESSLEAAALASDDVKSGAAGDIFETDFEIPPMEDSDSEAVALESGDSDTEVADSDFEVQLDEGESAEKDSSTSEVVLLEDEEEAAPAKSRRAVEVVEEGDVDLAEVEDEDSVAGALMGVSPKADEEEEEEEPVGAYRPVPWGPIPALFLLPALLFVLVGGLMSYELLQTMWGYQQPKKPTAPLLRAIASNLDMELKDQ